MPLFFVWAEFNPREAYRTFNGGPNIDPVPEAEIDRTILAREFEGVCQPRAYLDDKPVYAVINLEGVSLEKKNFEFSELYIFKRDVIDFLNKTDNIENNCKKLAQCITRISVNFIKIGEFPLANLYRNRKEGKKYIDDIHHIHADINHRFSVAKCLSDPENGDYFFYSPWFYTK
jgi:hypothetical protein